METLKQRRLLSTKTFQLHENKIVIIEKSIFEDTEWEAGYDEIGLDLVKFKSREGIGNVILFGGLLIPCTHITYKTFTTHADIKLGFLFLFFWIMYATVLWWSIQKYFFAHFILNGGDKTLTFFINSPDEKTVRLFIENIKTRKKEKMKNDLTAFDPDLSFEEQLYQLKFLKRLEIINQNEFDLIRDYLKEMHLIK